MSYFQDIKVLIYVKRGVYTQTKAERNSEKYEMLKVLMATAYREVEVAVKKLSPNANFVWHPEHYMLEIDMPHARWELRFAEVRLIDDVLDELHKEHGYVWETGCADLEDYQRSRTSKAKEIQNPLLKINASIKVMI